VGNSHTRQICQVIGCQYETLQYIEPELNNTQIDEMRRGAYYLIKFRNHAKLHLVTNHALFYSRRWVEYLEEMVHQKLTTFDAILVGKINTYLEAFKTSVMEIMKEKNSKLKDADFETIPPPTLVDFAALFHFSMDP